jgi:hypothetical protein
MARAPTSYVIALAAHEDSKIPNSQVGEQRPRIVLSTQKYQYEDLSFATNTHQLHNPKQNKMDGAAGILVAILSFFCKRPLLVPHEPC